MLHLPGGDLCLLNEPILRVSNWSRSVLAAFCWTLAGSASPTTDGAGVAFGVFSAEKSPVVLDIPDVLGFLLQVHPNILILIFLALPHSFGFHQGTVYVVHSPQLVTS